MSIANNYTTRQAASIGLQPGNLIGETHYVTESQITPPIKQRIRSKKLLSTNISRCQCCCPPFASSLCRSCLCPCWAYILIGLLLALLLAALAVELGLLSREKIIYRTQIKTCVNYLNITEIVNDSRNQTFGTSTSVSNLCDPNGTITGSGSYIWPSLTYLYLSITFLIFSTIP